MATWIFQGNPETFDIDGYLAASNGVITWLAPKLTAEIKPGDTAYIWRSGAEKGLPAGIVAAGSVLDQPSVQADDPISKPFWKSPDTGHAPRVKIRLSRVASIKEVLKREWMKEDSVLSNMLIMKQPAGTVFRVQPAEAERLDQLWRKTGTDWSKDEVIAALWLYSETYQQPISKSPGSPVEQTAQRIGRAVTGVYNKLMNIRSIDPRDDRKGFEGGSKVDQAVWDEYFNSANGTLDIQSLNDDYLRLWGATDRATPNSDAVDKSEEKRLADKPIEWLLQQYEARPKNTAPTRRSQDTFSFDRDTLVVTLRKRLAVYQCEVDGCSSPRFKTDLGEHFVEVHHLEPLSEGGPDTLENTVCLCPTHHRMIHHGTTRMELQKALVGKRSGEIAK